ncbi:hypothetical protein [Flavobacterium sandaracinum]|uniref:Uncharacterized protein n=1 Tax=Flavobacterium sandaracinum TaxID=2541733 RepID=A0A4R5CXX3_9FLAO|nr:hypothetical protein [Flavobacterium sandaracinum]TDE04380.1 hypothetical protein E0F91_08680 [Flavobacterium sandaracinum]
MTKTILIFTLLFNLISCAKTTKIESLKNETEIIKNNVEQENNEITIKYSTPIKGYNVSVKWLIRGKLEVQWSEKFSGPAILTFENIDTKEESWVLHPEFTIDINEENLKYLTFKNGEFVKNQSFTQISKYTKPKLEKVGTTHKEEDDLGYTYIPFFFQDVDFDGIDELILTYATTYEKGGSQNKIFKSPGYDSLEFSEMTNEPYTNFSGFYQGNPSADAYSYTTIDYKNKTITHHGLSGAGGSGSIIYEFKKSQTEDDYQLFKKTDTNNYENWEINETTIYKYDNYGKIINVDKTKTTNG